MSGGDGASGGVARMAGSMGIVTGEGDRVAEADWGDALYPRQAAAVGCC